MKFGICLVLAGAFWPGLAMATDKDRKWSIAVDGGTSTSVDQPFVSASVTRDIGDSYVQLAVAQVSTADRGSVRDAIPAVTRQVTISAGTTSGALSVDGFVRIGDRQFKTARIDRGGKTITLETSGSTVGGGVTVTYDHPLGKALFVSPYLAFDYNRIETVRTLTGLGGGVAPIRQPQDSATVSGGVALQYLFGPDTRHALAGLASFVITSNNAAVDRSDAHGGATRALGILAGPGSSGSWGELGAIASFGLDDRLSVNIAGVRTLGFAGGDGLSISAGTKIRF